MNGLAEIDGLRVGQLVRVQMYHPTRPKIIDDIETCVWAGNEYNQYELIAELTHVVPHYNSAGYAQSMGADIESKDVTRYIWHETSKRGVDAWGAAESDWCVIEDASAAMGMLF